MSETYTLKFRLASDATFGRGDGLAGEVNVEVQHDEYGFPYLSGKTLKGLLAACCAEILSSIKRFRPEEDLPGWQAAARRLFGEPGSQEDTIGLVWFCDACLPEDLRGAVAYQIEENGLDPRIVLELLTTLRRQTAMDAESGAPKKDTLRTMRVILRETPFEAQLIFRRKPELLDLPLLAACLRAFRRAGTGRNRGRGKLEEVGLFNPAGLAVDESCFTDFQRKVAP